jgi:hypothetical protein
MKLGKSAHQVRGPAEAVHRVLMSNNVNYLDWAGWPQL